jgi:hypothetical protein
MYFIISNILCRVENQFRKYGDDRFISNFSWYDFSL